MQHLKAKKDKPKFEFRTLLIHPPNHSLSQTLARLFFSRHQLSVRRALAQLLSFTARLATERNQVREGERRERKGPRRASEGHMRSEGHSSSRVPISGKKGLSLNILIGNEERLCSS